MNKIQIIIASTRPGRMGPQIARWMSELATARDELDVELVDLADWPLPLFNEPKHPMTGEYSQAITKAWSAKIAAADAYIIVTPEYNHGYPAAIKNALDYLYHEWTGKPVAFVSYGTLGGVRAAEQLRQVVAHLGMLQAQTQVAVQLSRDGLDLAKYASVADQMLDQLTALLKLRAAQTKTPALK